ncbi:hypothetical protein [Azospira restricta]|nr:hypothetical protein [Azospira restricta]
MGKLFLSMLIGAIVMLVVNDDARGGLRDSLRTAALALAEAVRQ